MQDKWSDFDEQYYLCKQGEAELIGNGNKDGIKRMVGLIEAVLAVQKKGN